MSRAEIPVNELRGRNIFISRNVPLFHEGVWRQRFSDRARYREGRWRRSLTYLKMPSPKSEKYSRKTSIADIIRAW